MKRNLLKGIVLIGAIALSSCSTTHKLTGTKNADDDVYYTKASAGDQTEYANNYQGYNGDDDYYYYGDYASRINRFNYFTPFDYDDSFYYNYSPVNQFSLGFTFNSPYGLGPMYSPFGYGYMPYYDLGGYDDIGYGGIYSAYLYGGGHRWRQNARPNYLGGKANRNTPITYRSVYTGNNTLVNRLFYPGRPVASGNNRNNPNTRMVRPERDTRQDMQQNFNRASSPPPSSSGGGGNSGGGGGGRPVRP